MHPAKCPATVLTLVETNPVAGPHPDLPPAPLVFPPLREENGLRLGLLKADCVVPRPLEPGSGTSLQLPHDVVQVRPSNYPRDLVHI